MGKLRTRSGPRPSTFRRGVALVDEATRRPDPLPTTSRPQQTGQRIVNTVPGEAESPVRVGAFTHRARPRHGSIRDMPDASPHRFQAGRTGLIVRIPEAEPAVSAWRERFDTSARAGVPAHVTVVFPFLDGSRVQGHVHRALAEVLGGHHAFDVRFARCERFPGVLYLAPEPDAPLRRLTEAVVERWPEAPPYGGVFTEVIPHLTVADGQDDTVLTEIETALHTELPFTARVSSVDLMVHDGVKWQLQATFDLPASPRSARE